MNPLVSVLMPVYNALPFLDEAVQSVLDQTWTDFELVAIDDGSSDGSWGRLKEFAERDRRVVIHRIDHGGIVAALNAGLALCRGEFVARADADDRCRPNRLAQQVAYLQSHPEVAVVGTDLLRIDETGRPICTLGVKVHHEQIEAVMLRGRTGTLTHATTMSRRAALIDAGGYREAYRHAEDLDLFLRVAEAGRLANVDEVLYEVRQHLGSITRKDSQRRLYELKRQIVNEARSRRGLDAIEQLELGSQDVDADGHRLIWAWRAAGALHRDTANRLAWTVARRRPWRWRAWAILLLNGIPLPLLRSIRDRRRRRIVAAAFPGRPE